MSKLGKELQARCDAEAKEYIGLHPEDAYKASQQGYKDGFAACHSAYLEMAGQGFDFDAAKDQAKHEDSDGYFGFLTGAEWQHCRDVALLTELRAENEKLRAYNENSMVNKRNIGDIILENKAKDAEINELKFELSNLRNVYKTVDGMKIQLEHNTADIIKGKDVRIAELEAQLGVAVEALESTIGWTFTHAMQTYSKAAQEAGEKANEALASLKGEKS